MSGLSPSQALAAASASWNPLANDASARAVDLNAAWKIVFEQEHSVALAHDKGPGGVAGEEPDTADADEGASDWLRTPVARESVAQMSPSSALLGDAGASGAGADALVREAAGIVDPAELTAAVRVGAAAGAGAADAVTTASGAATAPSGAAAVADATAAAPAAGATNTAVASVTWVVSAAATPQHAATSAAESVCVFVDAAGVSIVVRDPAISRHNAVLSAFEAAHSLTGRRAALRQLTLNGCTVYQQPTDRPDSQASGLVFAC